MVNSSIGKILVVDDEVELKNILVEALASQGYETAGFTSGEEALAALREEAFDVLLTDLMMPGMDGITLVRESLQIDPHLVCMMMTGQGTIQTAVDAMKEGAFDYVLKPFRLQTVLPVLTRAMNTRHMRLENLQLRDTVAIYGLAQTIAFTLDPQTVISKLADAALQQTDADEVSVLLPTADGDELYVAAVRGEKHQRLLGERVPLEEGISSWVMHERTPLILDGEVNDERFLALWPRPEIRSAISVPMQVANKIVGTININALNRARPFTLGQMKALTILAGTAAAALESASLYAQVQKAEKNYRSIFENAIEGIFQSTPEGRFTTVNPALARILGYDSPEEVIEKITDVAHQLYVDPAARDEAARLEESRGILQGFEFEAYRKDGERVWLSANRRVVRDENGEEICREGTIEDVTERKRAEEALRESEERYRDLVENSLELITTQDLDGQILSANRAAAKVLGYDRKDHIGKTNLRKLLAPEVRDRFDEYLTRIRRDGVASGLMIVQTRTGERRIWEYHNTLRTEGVGTPIVRSVARDVTERKRAEGRLAAQYVVTRALADSVTLAEATPKILRALCETLGWAWGALWTVDHKANVLRCHEVWHDPSLQLAQFEEGSRELTFAPGVGLPGRVWADGRPAWVPDVAQDKNFFRAPIAAKENLHSALVVPIEAGSKVLGVMEFFSKEIREPEPELLAMMATLSSQIGQFIERQRAEEALNESEERYRELVENAIDIIYTRDLDGNITTINKAAERVTGYTRKEMLTMNIAQVIPPEYREKLAQIEAVRIAGTETTPYEMAIIAKDGRRIALEANTRMIEKNGVAVGVQGIARDITERKEAEQALRKSEESYRDLVENAHDIIYTHDLQGRYTSMNQAGAQITGYTLKEALALDLTKTVAPEYVEKAQEMIRKKLAGEKGTAYEMEIIHKDGHRITVEANTKLVFQNGVAVGVQGIARDVTERKLLEDQLRQSQKMEAIGQLAGGVAHDFNNLLTAIIGYSGLALQRIEDESPLKPYIEEIKKAGDRAANLTRQLLAFGRKQILQPLPLNLNDVITDLNKMLRRLIGEDIRLSARLDLDLKKIKADPGQIEQVVMNLVVNARDAMPRGGSLTIETANIQIDEEYAGRHIGVSSGAYVMLAVSDNGTGMDDETEARIFEPFFTTKDKGKGTGLGLSTVYGIVKQSGGNIWVYSEPGHGTTFKIYLPQVDDPVRTVQAKLEDDSIPGGSETVLLVEDEDVVRGLAQRILEEAGYRVITANGGAEAVTWCANNAETIHLLLTDVVMPDTSGKELAERLTSLRPQTKVLFMSGYTDEAIVHHGVLDSNVEFLQKPFTPTALSRKVRQVLDSNGLKLTSGEN